MNSLIRFEPYKSGYLTMENGEFYFIETEKISELQSCDRDYIIVINTNHPSHAYSMPLKVQLQATKACNLRCITCAVAEGRQSKEKSLSTAEMIKILDLLAYYGVLNIEWSGGEPLLKKDFFFLAEYAAKKGFSQNLLTNATLFNKGNVALIKKYFFRTQISLDGVDADFNKIVGVNCWKKFSDAVSLAVECGLNIVLACVLQKNNIETIGEIIDFCSEKKIDNLRISMQVPIGRSTCLTWDAYSQIIDRFRVIWPKLKQQADDRHLAVNCFLEKDVCEDDGVEDVGYLVSPGGYSFLYIDAYGDIYPFPFLITPDLKLGSIKKDDIRGIWNSSKLDYIRTLNYKTTGCCDCRLECAFAERSLVYAFTGKIDSPALPHYECRRR